MFLLNDQMILSYKSEGLLDIKPFNPKNLCPTYYYFSLGPRFQRWLPTELKWKSEQIDPPDNVLVVEPNGFLIIESQERFRCGKQVLGIFGMSTSLIRQGFSLRNSPFIDPNFPAESDVGVLELGLRNELPTKNTLELGKRIGKISFFNVADTYPIGDPGGSISGPDFRRRAGGGPPTPFYDDDPREGWKEVENHGRKQRGDAGG